jgi:hypothetical protein
MKRIRIVALFLVSAFALTAMATTASAAEIAPELGRCLATPGGKYTKNKCTVEGAASKPYEWFPGAVKPNFTVAGGKATLESVGKNTITCESFGGTGVVEGTQNDKAEVEFKKCVSVTFKVSCQNTGSPEGIIKVLLNSKKGNIGPKKYGVLITGQGAHVADFECGGGGSGLGNEVLVDGSLIGEEKTANKMSLTSTQTFKAAKGKQKVTKFSGAFGEGTESHTLSTTTGGKTEQSGQTNTDTVKAEELLETRTEKS